MAAKMSVLGPILSSYPYLRSAMVRFPLNHVFHQFEFVYKFNFGNAKPEEGYQYSDC